jgi:subtilisin family serine protease
MKVISRFAFLVSLLRASTSTAFNEDHADTSKQQLRRRNEANTTKESDPTLRHVFVKYSKEKHNTLMRSIQLQHDNKDTSLEINHDFPSLNAVAVTATEAEIKMLEADPDVEAIFDDPKRYPTEIIPSRVRETSTRDLATDEVKPDEQTRPYGIDLVQAPLVWQVGATGKGVKVCVIDSGLETSHEDFTSSDFTGASLSSGETWTEDGNGHGTHVSGIIAASDNDIGVVGVAPEAEIIMIKVSDWLMNRLRLSWTFCSNGVYRDNECTRFLVDQMRNMFIHRV